MVGINLYILSNNMQRLRSRGGKTDVGEYPNKKKKDKK
jgi:hypothetical protein